MPESIVDRLEFDKVRELLVSQCQFSLGMERAREVGPSSSSETVAYLLDVTRQARELIESLPRFGVGGARDIREAVDRAEIGSVLSPTDLLEVLDTVAAARNLRRGFSRADERQNRFPAFCEFLEFVADLPDLELEIRRSISEHGEILDSASETLARIRRQLRTAQTRAAERIRRYTQNIDHASALQEPIVTSRDGRYVVPVRADRRDQLPGVVHDTSSSGQTLFIEPVEMVELNNRTRELEAAEQHEIERILTRLTAAVADASEDLLETMDAMAAIDLALAKARLASRMRMTIPTIVDERSPHGPRIALNKARHPLLDVEEVVPIDVVLGDEFKILVITGPNTGGKTVALKTVGLMTLMAQSGLFITADEGSELPVFDGVFADIGDEQSIEQSLSTFSSHMTRVIATFRNVTARSLVLFDELGAGTDPQEGAALARAIISKLLDIGCLAIATTHYSELKTFAYSVSGVENASVEFDIESLAPTFRLLTGIPGRSNALAIARRLGMSDEVLADAQKYLDPDIEHADLLIAEIQQRRLAAELAQRKAETARADAESERAEARRVRSQARQEALDEIESELARARESIRRVRRMPSQLPQSEKMTRVDSARSELQSATSDLKQYIREKDEDISVSDRLRVGDRVELSALGGEGEIVGLSEDGYEADVFMGSFKVRQPIRNLKKVSAGGSTGPGVARRPAIRFPEPRRAVDMELHLRGQRTAGIEPVLDDYLDDAYLSHMPFVRIVHGKGTGALRDAVQRFLTGHPLVKRMETPPENEGGAGVTVVYLKES